MKFGLNLSLVVVCVLFSSIVSADVLEKNPGSSPETATFVRDSTISYPQGSSYQENDAMCSKYGTPTELDSASKASRLNGSGSDKSGDRGVVE